MRRRGWGGLCPTCWRSRAAPSRSARPADVNKIVRMTLSLVQHKMKLSNVEVETQLAENLPPVPCDQSQMQQVVLNLLLNAAEATQAKSRAAGGVSTVAGGRRGAPGGGG